MGQPKVATSHRHEKSERATTWLGAGSALFVAFLAHFPCCWGPQLLLLLAGSSVGASWLHFMEPLRPYLLGLAAIQVAVGFYLAYRPARAKCDDDSCAVCGGGRAHRRQRILIAWVIAAMVAALAFWPVAQSLHSHEHVPEVGLTHREP